MSKRKSWEIKGLEKNNRICDAARLIIKQRVKLLLNKIDEYFTNESDVSLHQVRIAIRRIRYNIELFTDCFDKKLFLRFYETINRLQNSTGELRDLDVLKLNLSSLFKDETIPMPVEILIKIDKKKTILREKINLELLRFKHSKVLKEFSLQLKQGGIL
jgi:CHAD domain-containing protein